jgi:hypothetical protein
MAAWAKALFVSLYLYIINSRAIKAREEVSTNEKLTFSDKKCNFFI